jgi:hypothetical protein
MKSANALISHRLGFSALPDDKPTTASHTLAWTPVIQKSPNCRPKLRTALWGAIGERLIVTVERGQRRLEMVFRTRLRPGIRRVLWLRTDKGQGERDRRRHVGRDTQAEDQTERIQTDRRCLKNVLVSVALQAVFYVGLISLITVALGHLTSPLETGLAQKLRNLAELFG